MDCFNNENNIAQEILNRVVQRIMSIITFKLQLLASNSCKWVCIGLECKLRVNGSALLA